ncbi:MAG: hypothetical protein Tsb0021_13970 [Chlamydiales bacterium]
MYQKYVKAQSLALQSTLIELFLSIPAFIINFNAALFGVLIALGAIIVLFLVALYFPHHFFAKQAKPGSPSEAFWRGFIWKSYFISCFERSPSIMVLIFDNWAIVGLLIYALFTVNPFYSCVLLGIAGGISLTVLWQYQFNIE